MPLDDATTAALYGVDLRLTDDGDLAVTPGGDLALATGTVAVAQALVMRLRTVPNSLPLHIDYGSTLLTKLIGAKAQDAQLTIARVNTEAKAMMEQDRRFVAIRDVKVTSDGTAVLIGLKLVLAGGEVLRSSDLAGVRIDELAVELSDLADAQLLDELADPALSDTVAGIDPAHPDYGDVPDFAQLLDRADDLEPPEFE